MITVSYYEVVRLIFIKLSCVIVEERNLVLV